jgi:hypothetical protein
MGKDDRASTMKMFFRIALRRCGHILLLDGNGTAFSKQAGFASIFRLKRGSAWMVEACLPELRDPTKDTDWNEA